MRHLLYLGKCDCGNIYLWENHMFERARCPRCKADDKTVSLQFLKFILDQE